MFNQNYTIHSLLYDMTGGRFKSKKMCNNGFHNYCLQTKVETTPVVESYKNPFITITRYEKRYVQFRRCHCCGKEIEL